MVCKTHNERMQSDDQPRGENTLVYSSISLAAWLLAADAQC